MSLVETIYATLLLGFIALFLLNLYPSSFVAIKRGEATYNADCLASNILEDLHARSFANLIPGAEPAYAKRDIGGIEYVPEVKIAYCTDNPAPLPAYDDRYLKSATVTVRWTYSSRPYSVVHEALLHNVTR